VGDRGVAGARKRVLTLLGAYAAAGAVGCVIAFYVQGSTTPSSCDDVLREGGPTRAPAGCYNSGDVDLLVGAALCLLALGVIVLLMRRQRPRNGAAYEKSPATGR
jgi:hypothetical protein